MTARLCPARLSTLLAKTACNFQPQKRPKKGFPIGESYLEHRDGIADSVQTLRFQSKPPGYNCSAWGKRPALILLISPPPSPREIASI